MVYRGHDYDARVEPLRDAAGNVTGILGIVIDITPRKQAEREMARFATIVQASNDAIYGTDLHGRVVNWNPVAERLYGWTAAEALGQPLDFIYPSEQLPLYSSNLERILGGEQLDQFETERLRKDGRRVDVLLSIFPVSDPAGAIVAIATIARDITGRKRAERMRTRLAAIVAASDDAVVSTDLNAIVTSWNAGAEQTFGYTAGEMIGQPIALIFAPDDRPDFIEMGKHLDRGSGEVRMDEQRVRKDGTLMQVSVSVFPFAMPRDG